MVFHFGYKRIKEKNGTEWDIETGKEVFRDTTGRPYILVDDPEFQQENLKVQYPDQNKHEYGLLILAFFRRTIQDASGPNLYDNTITEQDRREARKYLIQGKLEKYGYYYFEEKEENKNRTYEKKFTNFIQTPEKQQSMITLKNITDFANIDETAMKERIENWKDNNWSTDHSFFISTMDATRAVGG